MEKSKKALLIGGAFLLGTLVLYRREVQSEVEELLSNRNIAAFLKAIRSGESSTNADAYQMLYGGGYFSDMSDHPYSTGEWNGVALPDAWCLAAGYNEGCITTAAGAYQFTVTKWRILEALYGLEDFSPPNQDRAAILVLKEENAVDDILAGRISSALDKVDEEWASLPGASYGQPTVQLANWLNTYENNGGVITA